MAVRFDGICPVCGWQGEFTQDQHDGRVAREFPCSECGSRLVYQAEAAVILDELGRGRHLCLDALVADERFTRLRILHVGTAGPIRNRLKGLPGYSESAYDPEARPGARLAKHIDRTVQDHEQLTFASDTFDLMLSSHVVEHVAEPERAFAEAHRVLRPGGRYIFSLPTRFPLPEQSRTRARRHGDEIEHLVDEPAFHSSPRGEPTLVFTEFGADVVELLGRVGLRGSIRRPHRSIEVAVRNAVVVATKDGTPISDRGAHGPRRTRWWRR